MLEKFNIEFTNKELSGDYALLISEAIKNNYTEKNAIYSFPQIQKVGVELKNRVDKKILELGFKREFNAGFVVDHTNNVLFKVFLLN